MRRALAQLRISDRFAKNEQEREGSDSKPAPSLVSRVLEGLLSAPFRITNDTLEFSPFVPLLFCLPGWSAKKWQNAS